MKVSRITLFIVSFCLAVAQLIARTEVLFSPSDKPTKRLLELINTSKRSIHAAVYMITDKTIAEALIEAKTKRGVDVQIVTDKITYDSIFGKGKLLQEKGIALFIYNEVTPKPAKSNITNPSKSERFFPNGPIMHHKFALFDNTKLWTGSFNWTASANRCNQENVVITDEQDVCKRFEGCFDHLKGLCQQRSFIENKEAPSNKEAPTLETLMRMVKAFFRLPRTA